MAGHGVAAMFAALLRFQPTNRLGDSIIPIADRRYRPCFSDLLLPLNRRRRCTLRLAFGKAWIVFLTEGDQQHYPQGYEG